MSTTTTTSSQSGRSEARVLDERLIEQFAEKVAADQAVTNNGVLAYLGDRLGLWRGMASAGAVTSEELADFTGLAERYVREWLAAQAAAGYVTYDPSTRRFELPAEHAAVLADDDGLASGAGGFEFNAAVWASADRLAHAFATGDGIPWGEHDPRLFTGSERFYRPLYATYLVDEWLPAVGTLVESLSSGIRVLDVGCGLGTATLMMARAFAASTFIGVDDHRESIERASARADRAGLSGRVSFDQVGALEYSGGPYDVICFFDALHDLGDPAAALRHARNHLSPDGVLLAVEPAAADKLEDNLNPMGLGWYAASATVCVPGSLSQPGRAALGAQAGLGRLSEAFREAGFVDVRAAASTPFNVVIEGRP